MKTSEKVQASQLIDEALADFIVLQNRITDLESSEFNTRMAIADLKGQFLRVEKMFSFLESVLPTEASSTVLKNVLGEERYDNLLVEAQRGIAYGISIKRMNREDLMVLVILYAEKQQIIREVLRQFIAIGEI